MTDNVYEPPKSELIEESDPTSRSFYVVSRKKLLVLYLSTLGLYAIYWFYANWQRFRTNSDQKNLWPIPRAIFYIFFTHSLFNWIDSRLKMQNIEFNWAPKILATVFVIITIASNLIDRMAYQQYGSPYTDFASLALLPITLAVLMKAQKAINLGQGDPDGDTNSRFTVYNYLWILLGIILWLLILFGLLGTLGVIYIPE